MAEIFDVFLSYNHDDKEAVRELVHALRARGVRIWRDGDNLPLGQPWLRMVQEVIPAAPAAVTVIGPSGLGNWHLREIEALLDENVRRKMPLIPVLLPGASDPLLPFLSTLTWSDLRVGLLQEVLDELAQRILKQPGKILDASERASELAKILDSLRTKTPINRAEMAVLLVHATRGPGFVPPPAQGIFWDVPTSYRAAAFIEQLYRERIIMGRSLGLYHPKASVLRSEIAVVLIRLVHGISYIPPRATGTIFKDVPADHWAAVYIEQLYKDGITRGCSKKPPLYCPDQPVSKEQMAIFLRKIFL